MFPRHTNLPPALYQAFLRPIALLLRTFICAHVFTFLTGLSLTATVPSQNEPWANCLFAALNFLSLTPRHFFAIMPRSATRQAKRYIAGNIKFDMSKTLRTYYCRPSLLLRVVTPTGFSITIRAILDTGCTCSNITKELATLLLANGATSQFVWPKKSITLDNYGLMPKYQTLSGVSLQSLEDESIIVPPSTFNIIKRWPFYIENVPFDIISKRMASLGLPMVATPNALGKTIWSKDEPR